LRIFVYEYVTGGGMLQQARLPATLRTQGAAMLTALAGDFAALRGAEVLVLRERRCRRLKLPGCVIDVATPEEAQRAWTRAVTCSDWTVVIAPEQGHALLQCCRRVLAAGGKLLGPPLELVQLASSKHATAVHLRAEGLPVPEGHLLPPGAPLPRWARWPSVLKPDDGAGSEQVVLLRGWKPRRLTDRWWRLEAYCAGEPASVAVLGGTAGCVVLPPCRQRISCNGRFAYRGGQLPLPRKLAQRAVRLAQRTVAALPRHLGYLGIDLILGDATDGSRDVVVEVNPRLTTSYVGLRAACRGNLAEAMLQLASGTVPQLGFRPQPVVFAPDGTCRPIAVGRDRARSP
jgi:predicted ATP-grasp superfamily ATP-dependent carboligase